MALPSFEDPLTCFAAGALSTACILLPAFLLFGRKSSGAAKHTPKPITLSGDEKKDFLVVFNALTAEVLEAVDQYNLRPKSTY